MIYLSQFSNKRVLILGMGKTGLSLVVNLVHCYCKQIIIYDDNAETINNLLYSDDPKALMLKDSLDSAIEFYNAKIHSLKDLDYVLVSPGINHKKHPLIRKVRRLGITITSDIEEFVKATPRNIQIAITGTNGKSTTCNLLYQVLSPYKQYVQLGGNIGKPVSDLIFYDAPAINVLEVSSFQVELLVAAKFDVVAILNVTEDHLDRYRNFNEYLAAKEKLLHHLKDGGLALFSTDCPHSYALYLKYKKSIDNIILVSTEPSAPMIKRKEEKGVHLINIVDGVLNCAFNKSLKLKLPLSLQGAHNGQNIGFAYAVASRLGLKNSQFAKMVAHYQGLPHRTEVILKTPQAIFINDSKATNTDAMLKALSAFNNILLILGGKVKDENLKQILPYRDHIKECFVIGKERRYFIKVLKDLGLEFYEAKTLENAILLIKQRLEKPKAKKGKEKMTVLLSPGAASFDQFRNFEHRGQVFKQLVLDNWGKKKLFFLRRK